MILDAETLCSSLASLGPGERITYHVGNLTHDRQATLGRAGSLSPRRINMVGNAAYELYKKKRLHLVQRRMHEVTGTLYPYYEYIAIGR